MFLYFEEGKIKLMAYTLCCVLEFSRGWLCCIYYSNTEICPTLPYFDLLDQAVNNILIWTLLIFHVMCINMMYAAKRWKIKIRYRVNVMPKGHSMRTVVWLFQQSRGNNEMKLNRNYKCDKRGWHWLILFYMIWEWIANCVTYKLESFFHAR